MTARASNGAPDLVARNLAAYLADRNRNPWHVMNAVREFGRTFPGEALPAWLTHKLLSALEMIYAGTRGTRPPSFPDPRQSLLRDVGLRDEVEALCRAGKFKSERAAMRHVAERHGLKFNALKACLLRTRVPKSRTLTPTNGSD